MPSSPEHSFIDAIAEAVERRLSSRLDDLHDAIRKARSLREDPRPDDDGVRGLDPNALYSVSSVADRWDVSTDFVRNLDEATLPRAAWPGNDIRYRGVDVLRAEGIDSVATNIHLMGGDGSSGDNPPQSPNRKKRVYTKDLPPLPS